jgi:RNA polymerase sigma-70 factor (ECF subfamily)
MSRPPDTRDFEALYDRCAASVLSYCARRTTLELAEDALAETFSVAWRRRDAIPSEPLPWLYGVARKVIANQRRSARRQAGVARRLVEEAPAPSAHETPETPESSRRVLAALSRLGETDRELLLLVAWEGLKPAEAARVLGIAPARCRLRLHRARRRLERLVAHADRPSETELKAQAKEAPS